jgi:hypothetical protein
MRPVRLQKPLTADDGYGFMKDEYVDAGTADVYMTSLVSSAINSNNLELLQMQHTAYTMNTEIKVGWLVDGLKVTSVVPARNFVTLTLQKIAGAKDER